MLGLSDLTEEFYGRVILLSMPKYCLCRKRQPLPEARAALAGELCFLDLLPSGVPVDPTDIAFIKGVVTFGLLAVTGLSAYWLRIRSRALRGVDQPALERLEQDLERTRQDLETRVLELEERLDFTERRLLQGNSPVARPPSLRETTPV